MEACSNENDQVKLQPLQMQSLAGNNSCGTSETKNKKSEMLSELNDEDMITTTTATMDNSPNKKRKKKKKKRKKGKSPDSKRKKEDMILPIQRQTRLRTREADNDPNYVLFGGLPDTTGMGSASGGSIFHTSLTNSGRKNATASNTTIQYSDSYVDLFTRDLSIEECNRMEAYLLSLSSSTKVNVSIPHWTCCYPALLHQQQRQLVIQHPTPHSSATSIPTWWSHDISQQMAKPTWRSLRYHTFYNSGDYTKVPVKKKNRTTCHENIQSYNRNNCEEEEEVIQSTPQLMKFLTTKVEQQALQNPNIPNKDEFSDATTAKSEATGRMLGSQPNATTTPISNPSKSIEGDAMKDTMDGQPKAAGTNRKGNIPRAETDIVPSYYRLPTESIPIQRACTVLANSIQHPNIFAIGDTAGYISIYTYYSLTSIGRLETEASRRYHCHSNSTHSANNANAPTTSPDDPPYASSFRSSLISNKDRKESLAAKSPYSIEALCFVPKDKEENIAYASKHAVEILSPTGGSILWTMSLDGFSEVVLTIDACPFKTSKLCIGFQEYFHGESPLVVSTPTPSTIPVALTWEDGLTPTLPIGPRAIALWSKRTANKLLCVVITKSEEEDSLVIQQELIAVQVKTESIHHDGISNDRWVFRIQNNAVLPMLKTAARWVPNESLCLSEDGTLVAVASSGGGIRIYMEDTLELLGVYGEGIRMHGHTVVWQKVILAYVEISAHNNNNHSSRRSQLVGMEEHEDEVSFRFHHRNTPEHNSNLKQNVYLMAVPHPHREPKDLRDTIHVWDISNHLPSSFNDMQHSRSQITTCTAKIAAQVPDMPRVNMTLPTFTLAEPPSSSGALSNTVRKATQGIQTLLFSPSSLTSCGAQLLMTTHGTGECFVLSRSVRSSWAGCMYDPDYLTITNNIDYVEDEDELDYNVDAYREIMLQNKQKKELALLDPSAACHLDNDEEDDDNRGEVDVDVIGGCTTGRSAEPQFCPWICTPEHFLQSKLFDNDADALPEETDIANGKDSASNLDAFISLLPPLVEEAKRRSGIIRFDSNVSSQSAGGGAPRRRPAGRSIDSLIVSSINEDLQKEMTRRETVTVQNNWTSEYKNVACFACRGRLVSHSCGRRLIPEDLDAIRREEEERKNRLKEEDKQRRLDKKKAADLKRKLENQQRKEEKRKEEEMDVIKVDEAPRTEDVSDSVGQALSLEVKEAADLMGLLKSGYDQKRYSSDLREPQPISTANQNFSEIEDEQCWANRPGNADNASHQHGISINQLFDSENSRAQVQCRNETTLVRPSTTLPDSAHIQSALGKGDSQVHKAPQQGSLSVFTCQSPQTRSGFLHHPPDKSNHSHCIQKHPHFNPSHSAMNPQDYPPTHDNSPNVTSYNQPQIKSSFRSSHGGVKLPHYQQSDSNPTLLVKQSSFSPERTYRHQQLIQHSSNSTQTTLITPGYQSNSKPTHCMDLAHDNYPPERSQYPPQKHTNLNPTKDFVILQGYQQSSSNLSHSLDLQPTNSTPNHGNRQPEMSSYRLPEQSRMISSQGNIDPRACQQFHANQTFDTLNHQSYVKEPISSNERQYNPPQEQSNSNSITRQEYLQSSSNPSHGRLKHLNQPQQINSSSSYDGYYSKGPHYPQQSHLNLKPMHNRVDVVSNPQGYFKKSNLNPTHENHQRNYHPPQMQSNLNFAYGTMNPQVHQKPTDFNIFPGAPTPEPSTNESILVLSRADLESAHQPVEHKLETASYIQSKHRIYQQNINLCGVEQPSDDACRAPSDHNSVSMQHFSRERDI